MLGLVLAPGEFDIWVLFFDEFVSCFVVLYSSSRKLLVQMFSFFFFFICLVIILMWPRLLMDAGTKAHIQLLLEQMGPLEKILSLYCLLIYLKR